MFLLFWLLAGSLLCHFLGIGSYMNVWAVSHVYNETTDIQMPDKYIPDQW